MESTAIRERELINERNLAERRLAAIVKAINQHEAGHRRMPYRRRAEDLSLYRRTREILGADA
jgi:hypothetical protein